MSRIYNRREVLKTTCAALIGTSLTAKSVMATENPSSTDKRALEYVFPPPVRSLAITGSKKRFPVRRIYCIGMNYPRPRQLLEQVPSMAQPTGIVIFDKYSDAIVEDGADITYPQGTRNLSYGVELVVAMGKETANVNDAQALNSIFGYAVGNDLTRGDLMRAAMESHGALDVGKAFDGSAPCGPIHPVSSIGHLNEARMWLTIDGDLMQEGNLKDSLKKPPALISELSHLYHLQPGDLIYTGTPGIHGAVEKNQTMVCGIDGLGTLTNKVI